MATKNQKVQIEVLFAGAEIGGIRMQPHLVKTSRLVTVDMVCPRATIARKTVAKEVKFQKAKADAKGQCWTEAGKSATVEVPLHRPKFAKTVGHVKLELRA